MPMAYRVSCYTHSPHLITSFKIVIYLIIEHNYTSSINTFPWQSVPFISFVEKIHTFLCLIYGSGSFTPRTFSPQTFPPWTFAPPPPPPERINQTIFIYNSRDFESGNYICHVSDAQLSRYCLRKRRYYEKRPLILSIFVIV